MVDLSNFLTSGFLASGFLPSRASWMLDFVTLAMLVVLIVLALSIYVVRFKNNPVLHRNIQIATSIILTLALIGFEIDVRFITKWRELAEPSPFYESGVVDWCLAVHLLFAIPTPIVWAVVIFMALRRFKSGRFQIPATQNEKSNKDFNRFHRTSGRIAAIFMLLTAVTGWIFYYVAFVA